MALIVRYSVQLPGNTLEPEEPSGTLTFALEEGEKLSVARLREAWPFEGAFHFRAQVATGEGYVFMDLPSDGAAIPVAADGGATIRALPLFDLSLPDDDLAVQPAMHPDSYSAAVAARVARIGLEPWDPARFPVVYSIDSDAAPARPYPGSPAASPPPQAQTAPASRQSPPDSGSVPGLGGSSRPSYEEGSYWGETGEEGSSSPDHQQQQQQQFSDTSGEVPMPAFHDEDGVRERGTGATGGSGGGGLKGFFASAQRAVEKAANRAVAAVEAAAERVGESGAATSSSWEGGKKSGGGWLGSITKGAKHLIIGGGGQKGSGAGGHSTALGDPASEEARVNLSAAQVQYATAFRPEFEPHEMLLQRLWDASAEAGAVQGEFVRVGPQWMELGFQQEDPATDLRSGGLLALHSLIHFAEAYPRVFAALVENGSGHASRAGSGGSSSYPPAQVIINICSRVAELLGLNGEESSLGAPRAGVPTWEVFASSHEAFFELVVAAARAFDHIWRVRNARVADFDKILAATVDGKVHDWLGKGPRTIAELREVAAAHGE